MQAQGDCFSSAGDYTTCVAAGAAGNSRFSTWAVDSNRYADVDSNPYVVGSRAYAIAHGLALPADWNDRTTAAAEHRALLDTAAVQIIAESGTAQGAASHATDAALIGSSAASGLIPLALIALVLLVLKR